MNRRFGTMCLKVPFIKAIKGVLECYKMGVVSPCKTLKFICSNLMLLIHIVLRIKSTPYCV